MSDLGGLVVAIVVGTILNLFVIYGAYREGWRNGALSGYRTGVRNLTPGIPRDDAPDAAHANVAPLETVTDEERLLGPGPFRDRLDDMARERYGIDLTKRPRP